MKKLCFIGILLALTPSLSFGDDFRVNKLIQEKQRKMAELEKCMGSTKGLKIAGISTLGLTAVGVVGNVAEAKKINEYDDKIESTEKSIEKTQKQIDETRADLAKQKAEAEEKKRKEELKKNCLQSRGEWEDDGYCECGTRNYNSTTGKCEDVTIATVQLANGNTVTGVLNPATGVLTDPNGSVIDTAGGTIVSTATVAAGTDSGTSTSGTDGDAANHDDNTPDTPAGAVECGVTCDSSYNNKTIACEGSDNNSKVELYECANGAWTQKGSISDCSNFTAPNSYKKVGKWKTGFVFASNKTEISGASPKAWNISNYCEACESGQYKKSGSCVKDNRCEFDGRKFDVGKKEEGVCKEANGNVLIQNAKTCTWTCQKDGWHYTLKECDDNYTPSNGQCIQNKKTLIELVGSNISKGPSGWYARTNDGQCWLNNNSSDAKGSCSSLTKNQWMAEFSWGYIRGNSRCDDGQCKCNLRLLYFSGNQKTHNFNSWYNHTNYQFPEHCRGGCAHGCSQSVIEDFRRKEAFEAYGTEL